VYSVTILLLLLSSAILGAADLREMLEQHSAVQASQLTFYGILKELNVKSYSL